MTAVATTTFPAFAATAGAERGQIVVSLHDVAPVTREISEKILHDLAQAGVKVCSLLVVPDYHGKGRSCADGQFVRWLRDLEVSGHEIVIHGYYHERPARAEDRFARRFLTQSYTAGEGEFYDLPYAEALRRIEKARDEFREAGLHPHGFIAPAWLLGPEAERAAADAGMEYTTRLTRVIDLRTNESHRARSLVYSARSGWRRTLSLAWNATLARATANQPLVRLGVHPADFEHEALRGQIMRLARDFMMACTPTTYCDWVARRRLSAANSDR